MSSSARFASKPESSSVATAVSWSSEVTSGTAAVVGPRETVSVIVAPLGAVSPPAGDWSITTPRG